MIQGRDVPAILQEHVDSPVRVPGKLFRLEKQRFGYYTAAGARAARVFQHCRLGGLPL
jgi:hypothetical protein